MVLVRKANGDLVEFDPEKVIRSCMRSGADRETAERVVQKVKPRIKSGMKTRKILKMVLKLLSEEGPQFAARYDLKGAIMRLGPAGFPFETFFGEVLAEYGYKTRLRTFLQGRCIPHEIDVIAKDEETGETLMIECKYKNLAGDYIGVKDILYTYARYLDLVEGCKTGACLEINGVWLATNTKFSREVIKYAKCKGINLTGWEYPGRKSLKRLVEKKKLYPITVLRSLDSFSQSRLGAAELMLCKDLLENDEDYIIEVTGIKRKKLRQMISEAESILS